MNTFSHRYPDMKARRRLAIALAVLILAPTAMFFFWVRPAQRDRSRLAVQASRLRSELARYAERYRDLPLEVLLDREQAATERILAEHDRIHARARTLREGMTLTDVLASGVEGRIDFKVTLFEARDRLGRIAEEKGVRLPPDLGISETIASAEQAQLRLWQLAATVLLIERCIETGIREITHIEALDPVVIAAASEGRPGVTAYPINIRFESPYGRFVSLLRSLGDDRKGFFALRSFWVRFATPQAPDVLDCRVVALALRVTPPAAEPAEPPPDGVPAMAVDLYEDPLPNEPEEDRP